MYIAAMQLFPIKLNFSFIKNADVKVCSESRRRDSGRLLLVSRLSGSLACLLPLAFRNMRKSLNGGLAVSARSTPDV